MDYYRFPSGSSFAGYTIDAPLGAGCAGETYLARRAGTRTNVALKIAWAELASAPRFAFEMQHQAKILQRFRHPNMCAVLDSGVSKGLPFWASEYVPGPNGKSFSLKSYLDDRLARGKMIGEEEIFIIAQEILGSLEALHKIRDREECPNGIALGDLRPANILLDANTKFRLCDLGISALVRSVAAEFARTRNIDTGYMSPEVRDGNPPTQRSDIYSFGSILYELLTGQKFSAGAQSPSEARPGIKPGWDELLQRCLAGRPDERFANMTELKNAIESIEKSPAVQAIAPENAAAPKEPARHAKPSEHGGDRKPVEPRKVRGVEKSFAKHIPQTRASSNAESNTGLWIGLCVAILACGGFAGGYYATHHGKNSAPSVSGTAQPSQTATAKRNPEGQPFLLSSAAIEMRWIPPAPSLLFEADDPDRKEGTQGVKCSATAAPGFWMADTEVSVAHWKKFIAANPNFKTTAEKKGEAATVDSSGDFHDVIGVNWRKPIEGVTVKDDHPVTCVTPGDIQAFCAWLTNIERDAGRISPEYSFRLPTDVEWEYACRGSATSRTKFWWGSDEETGRGRINGAGAEYSAKFPETQKYNFVWNDNHLYTSPVGAFGVKGRNAFGLSDMLGNVWECATLGPADKHEFTWRGGSFAEGSTIIRCASTRHRYTDKPAANAGFRVVLSK